ncbi:hypothetical protein EDC01DRAFT_635786 [Geopyxis carbonaria]|nr:hypothetical protein EDC01DRAFT_636163 [Geopyxis carbonaria]KAI5777430.1 hypothetical protein EDC01DRAFT_635786 [Geopyxis carbonaria]
MTQPPAAAKVAPRQPNEMDWEATSLSKMESQFNAMIRRYMDQRPGNGKPVNSRKCFECGKPGHIKKDCYMLKQKRGDGKKKEKRSKFNSIGLDDVESGTDSVEYVDVDGSEN